MPRGYEQLAPSYGHGPLFPAEGQNQSLGDLAERTRTMRAQQLVYNPVQFLGNTGKWADVLPVANVTIDPYKEHPALAGESAPQGNPFVWWHVIFEYSLCPTAGAPVSTAAWVTIRDSAEFPLGSSAPTVSEVAILPLISNSAGCGSLQYYTTHYGTTVMYPAEKAGPRTINLAAATAGGQWNLRIRSVVLDAGVL